MQLEQVAEGAALRIRWREGLARLDDGFAPAMVFDHHDGAPAEAVEVLLLQVC